MLWPDTRISLIGRLADPQDGRAWEEFERSYQSVISAGVFGPGWANKHLVSDKLLNSLFVSGNVR